MTRVIIEVKPNDAAREYAANTDGVEVYDDRIVLDGMAQHIRDAINALARIGMIEKPKPPRAVFFIRTSGFPTKTFMHTPWCQSLTETARSNKSLTITQAREY